MIISQDELVKLIQTVVNRETRYRINKRTTKTELVNEAYLYIMERQHNLDQLKNNPKKERSYIVRMIKTAIIKFYIRLDVVRFPQIQYRTSNLSVDDNENTVFRDTDDSFVDVFEKKNYINSWHNVIMKSFDILTNAETYVIENRVYCLEEDRKTLRELADDLQISRARVKQIEDQALDKICRYFYSDKVKQTLPVKEEL